MACGIYKFENNINHMIYIGQTIDLESRYKKHLQNISDLQHQEDFYCALREFGIENFSYEILEKFEIFNQDVLDALEKYYIDEVYHSLTPNGYNMVPGGSNGAGLSKSKKVYQYDLQGRFLREFSSAHQAGYETKISYSNICACCRKERPQAGPYQWRYNKEEVSSIKAKNYSGVLQYTKDGIFIKEYPTMEDAAKAVGCSKALICRVCKGQGKTGKGFIWRYKV